MNPHLIRSGSPVTMVRSVVAQRRLIYQLAQRDVSGRYRGSMGGIAWSLITPLLMLGVYTFVFSVVFKARWGIDTDEQKGMFAVIIFVGILVHGVFAECINKSPTLLLSHANYVKRVVFPLELLPVVVLLSALFHLAVSCVVLLATLLFVQGGIPLTALLFPIILLPLLLVILGLTWLLSALGVYVRDIGQFTAILTTVLMFMAPIFYPITALPEHVRPWLYLNPLSFIIEQSRMVLLWGGTPNWIGLIQYLIVGIVVASGGFWTFQKMRRGFADVL